ncbi:hypothetical protein HOH87_02275 [bacterium]|jgi:hypothetical protein|nr:hypothetical protein [bacterium]
MGQLSIGQLGQSESHSSESVNDVLNKVEARSERSLIGDGLLDSKETFMADRKKAMALVGQLLAKQGYESASKTADLKRNALLKGSGDHHMDSISNIFKKLISGDKDDNPNLK